MKREDRIAIRGMIRQRTRESFQFRVAHNRRRVADDSNDLSIGEIFAGLDPDVVLDDTFGVHVRAARSEVRRRNADVSLKWQSLEDLHRALLGYLREREG